MFILDDLVIVAGAGVLFLIIIGVKGVRRRRLKKRLREDDEFRDKVKEALDEQEVQWVVHGVTAGDDERLQVPVQRIGRRLRSKSEADALF
jgi:hypothetical protein